MPEYFLVRLIFTKPVRIGSIIKGVGNENAQYYINSDTLFSALCNVWFKYNILEPSEINALVNNDLFLISSAFPFSYLKDERIYFLPKPKMEFPFLQKYPTNERTNLKKLLKHSAFLPSDYIENYFVENSKIIESRFKDIERKINAQFKPFLEVSTPHHVQDRITSSSRLYYTGQLFNDHLKGGMFFLVKILDGSKEWQSIFNKGLIALSQEGIGGERSNMGTFLVDNNFGTLMPLSNYPELKFIYNASKSSDFNYILSLYYPSSKEVNGIKDSKCYYDLIIKKGWAFSSTSLVQLKRKSVPFFIEGSLFNFVPKGRVVDAKPKNYPHPVWRWGKAFAISL